MSGTLNCKHHLSGACACLRTGRSTCHEYNNWKADNTMVNEVTPEILVPAIRQYWQDGKIGPTFAFDFDETCKIVCLMEKQAKEMGLIMQLTVDELTNVTIHHPNPDFGGPAYVVDYTYWDYDVKHNKSVSCYGATLLECLQKAIDIKGAIR